MEVVSMATAGRANGMAPLCLAEFVTANDSEALTKACAGGKPMHILAGMRLTEK